VIVIVFGVLKFCHKPSQHAATGTHFSHMYYSLTY